MLNGYLNLAKVVLDFDPKTSGLPRCLDLGVLSSAPQLDDYESSSNRGPWIKTHFRAV